MAVSTNINIDYIPTGGQMREQNYQGNSSAWIGCVDLYTDGSLLFAGILNEPENGYVYTRSGRIQNTSIRGWVANGVASGTQVDFLNVTDLNAAYEYSRTEITEVIGTTSTTTTVTGRNFSYTIPTGVDSVTITLIYLPKGAKMYVPRNSNNTAVEPKRIYVPDSNEQSKKCLKVYVGSSASRSIKVFEE